VKIDLYDAARRAGFWRRYVAFVIDAVLVAIPFQIAVAILYPLTGGLVQMDGGLSFGACAETQIPELLSPSPPKDANSAEKCVTYFVAFPVANELEVARRSGEGATTEEASETYRLDAKGKVIAGYNLDRPAQAALLVYLIAMLPLYGRSLGQRLLGFRVIAVASRRKPSWGRSVLRNLGMSVGVFPLYFHEGVHLKIKASWFDALTSSGIVWGLGIVAIVLAGWSIVLAIQIVRKVDPYYDRWAGTAALIDASPLAPG